PQADGGREIDPLGSASEHRLGAEVNGNTGELTNLEMPTHLLPGFEHRDAHRPTQQPVQPPCRGDPADPTADHDDACRIWSPRRVGFSQHAAARPVRRGPASPGLYRATPRAPG